MTLTNTTGDRSDYRQPGAYFVTICAYRRQYLFSNVVDGRMVLNQYGIVVADTYR